VQQDAPHPLLFPHPGVRGQAQRRPAAMRRRVPANLPRADYYSLSRDAEIRAQEAASSQLLAFNIPALRKAIPRRPLEFDTFDRILQRTGEVATE
jgi:hypothetical protein